MWEAREGVPAVLGNANVWQRQDLQLEGDGSEQGRTGRQDS